MKKLFLLLFISSLGLLAKAQLDTAYTFNYGGLQNDICNQIRPTWDGGYIMVGTTNSFGCGNTDFYAIKVDSLCHKQWSEALGGPMNDLGYSVTPTLDKGFAFVGFTDSYGNGGYDAFLIKTDSLGKILWTKTYGGSDWDFGYSISPLADSGFIICGQTFSYGAGNGDVYVIRTDKNGDTLWTRAIGGTGYDLGNCVSVHNDSIYAITGLTTSYGIGDTSIYFILINDKGVVKKDTTFGCTHNAIGNSIRGTNDNGYAIFGYTDSITPGKPDETLLKLDSTGKQQWLQVYHVSGIGIGKDAMQVPDGSYVNVCTDNTTGAGGFCMYLQHMSAGGWYMNSASLGGILDEEGNSVALGKNGNIVSAGGTDSPGYTFGDNDMFAVRWINDDSISSKQVNYIKGYKDNIICTPAGIIPETAPQAGVKLFPDPVSSSATIIVQGTVGVHYFYNIYNEMGQCMAQEVPLSLTAHGQSVAHIGKGDLSAGIYFYKINDQSDQTVAVGKFIIE